jgi:hypothetical protein
MAVTVQGCTDCHQSDGACVEETLMNHIQRCLSALTTLAGALLGVFIRPAGPSVAGDRAMPNGGMPSGDFLGYRYRGRPRAVAAWGVIAPRRVGVIVAAAAASAIMMVAAACGSSDSTSGGSAPSALARHSANSPAQPPQASRAECQDAIALQASLANLLQVSIGKGALKQVQADVEDLQAKLSALTGGAHGAFSVQINALKSALTTLQTAVKGVSSGSGSVAEVRTAVDGVATATTNIVSALAKRGCIFGE